MKGILCLSLFFAAYALAEEAADRASIQHTIAALNEGPPPAALFTKDSDAFSEVEKLRTLKHLSMADRPNVTISHEPWGEATIHFPCTEDMMTTLPAPIRNRRMVIGAIRFLTPDVALSEGPWIYRDDSGTSHTTPMLFVLKKEEGRWKIASLRVLAPR